MLNQYILRLDDLMNITKIFQVHIETAMILNRIRSFHKLKLEPITKRVKVEFLFEKKIK